MDITAKNIKYICLIITVQLITVVEGDTEKSNVCPGMTLFIYLLSIRMVGGCCSLRSWGPSY
jgi:hypothetical protein